MRRRPPRLYCNRSGCRSGRRRSHGGYARAHELRRTLPAHCAIRWRSRRSPRISTSSTTRSSTRNSAFRTSASSARVRTCSHGVTVYPAQEYHTSFWGHLGLLHLDDHFLTPDFSAYQHSALTSPYPHNGAVADLAHRQNALVGYVHPYDWAIRSGQGEIADARAARRTLRSARPTTSKSSASPITGRRPTCGTDCSISAFAFRRARARMRWRTTRACAARSA